MKAGKAVEVVLKKFALPTNFPEDIQLLVDSLIKTHSENHLQNDSQVRSHFSMDQEKTLSSNAEIHFSSLELIKTVKIDLDARDASCNEQ